MVTQTDRQNNRAEQIREHLKQNWRDSNREIARQLGSTPTTIGKYRRELEKRGEILPRIENGHFVVPCLCEVSIFAIQSPPENDKLYDPIRKDDPEFLRLVEDIRKNGIINPLGVSVDGRVYDGNRRLAAARYLGMEKVPIRINPDVSWEDDRDDFIRLLVSCNSQRVKTTAEVIREQVIDTSPDTWDCLTDYRRSISEVNGVEHFTLTGTKTRSEIVKKRGLADAIVKVVKERYRKHGPTNDRKIFYLLLNWTGLLRNDVTKTPFANDAASYQDVTDLLTRLRLDGSIPFGAIQDETRPVIIWDTHRSIGSFIDSEFADFLCGYCRDLLQSQPNWIELLVEKNTVAGDLRPIAARYTLPMTSGRGYSSLPPRQAMVDRFKASGKEKMVLVAVSDFDPEGQDIPNAFGLSLRDDFGLRPDQLVVVKAALTHRQTKELDLHEGQFAKKEGIRYKRFVKAYGERCWELEAVETEALREIVDHTIQSVIDLEAFEREIEADCLPRRLWTSADDSRYRLNLIQNTRRLEKPCW